MTDYSKDWSEIRCQYAPWMNGIAVFILGPPGDGHARLVGEVTMHERPIGPSSVAPSLMLHDAAAVQLMDELWRAGVRPTQIGTAGHVQAQAAHIEDLRMVVKQILPSFLRPGIALLPNASELRERQDLVQADLDRDSMTRSTNRIG